MKQKCSFFLSIAGALVWLFLSIWLAVPWIAHLDEKLPLVYVLLVVFGIALLPGYLMCAMFLSNLMNRKRMPLTGAGTEQAVTVVICARNEERIIYRTIRAIAEQKYPGPIEILCVDNGSTDRTRAEILRAAEQLQSQTRRIRLLECAQPGKAYALNTALEEVKTRFFLTVDADTLLEKTAVAAIVERITVSGAACVAGNLLAAQPATWVQKMQIYDYLISIAAVKRYQGSYQSTLVAQGAFSAYDTHAVKRAGGWVQSAGEDIVLTYQLLAQGRASVYEPQAVGYTFTPGTLGALCRQRTRWAKGMIEGLRAVRPWGQPAASSGYFEALNLSIFFLDWAYVFGFLVGVVLALLGMPWFVGWLTLLTLPALLISSASVYRFQSKIPAVRIQNSFCGFICFVLFFQAIQSVCSLTGYLAALTKHALAWK